MRTYYSKLNRLKAITDYGYGNFGILKECFEIIDIINPSNYYGNPDKKTA